MRIKLFALAVCVLSTLAGAEPDTFGLGDGHTGPITVTAANTAINIYTQVTAPTAAGDTLLQVASVTGFVANDLIMVYQTTGIVPASASGNQTAINLSTNPVGSWELARISAVGTNSFTLTSKLIGSSASGVTQIIRVPEYTTVTVSAAASIVPGQNWDGLSGGVIAFLAQGAVTNNGTISANAAGFRGGQVLNDSTGKFGCTELDTPTGTATPAAWAQKGEGIVSGNYGSGIGGYGNLGNGAGGGDCHNSGGGGGGNGGQGGNGGATYVGDGSRAVGGLGGAALSYSLQDHFTLGGAGGAGQENDGVGSAGGVGGGAVFIRGATLSGTGSEQANGQTAASGGNDGQGGGGAGGSLYLRFTGTVVCGSITAQGGNGGSASAAQHGPGAGGGGGQVLIQGSSLGASCTPGVTSGAAGAANGASYGGTAPAPVGVTQTPTGGFPTPPAPAITSPTNGASLATQRPTVEGTAQPNTTVIIYFSNAVVGQTTSDGSGNWTFTPSSNIAEGTYQVQAAELVQGVQSTKSTPIVTVRLDVTAPVVPVISMPTSGALINSRQPTVSGSAEANSTVEVYVDGAPAPGRLIATVAADAAGAWSYTLVLGQSLPDGSHTFVATATDAAGNVSAPSVTDNFTVDATPPVAPVISTPANGAYIRNSRPTFSGTAETNSTVKVYVDGSLICTLAASSAGAWSCVPALSLGDGTRAVTATATDAAQNVGPAASSSFTLITQTPAAPLWSTPANGSFLATSTPTLSGTAPINTTVSVSIDGAVVCSIAVGNAGTWSCSPSLSDGARTGTATAVDLAGNVSGTSAAQNFTIDTHVPLAPVFTAPANGSTVSVSVPTLSGTSEAGATVKVSLDGGVVGTVTADSTGAWSVVLSATLTEGSHSASATAQDKAGTVSAPSSADVFMVDTDGPPAPNIAAPIANTFTNNPSPLLSGTAEASSLVTVALDGATACTVTADGSGNWSCTSATSLADGPHSASAVAKDAAGLTGPASVPVSFTVKTAAPAAPVIKDPVEKGLTNKPQPLIKGSSEPFSAVSVILDGSTTTSGTPVADGAGNWSFTPTTALADAPHTVQASATDRAGNVGTLSPVIHFTVDSKLPNPPTFLVPVDGSSTRNNLPAFSGTAPVPNSSTAIAVNVLVDGAVVCGNLIPDSTGGWSCASTIALIDGNHVVTGTVTKTLTGQPLVTSGASSPLSLSVDTDAPPAPTLATPLSNAVTNNAQPTFSGTTELLSSVTVTVNGVVVCTVNADSTGNWSCSPSTPLSNGTQSAVAQTADAAGNISAPSAATSFTVNTIVGAPTVTVPADGSVTNAASPLFSGKAQVGSTVQVTVDGSAGCSTVADSSGNWTCAAPTPLSDGPHAVTVSATDTLGNVSAASSTSHFAIDTAIPSSPAILSPQASVTLSQLFPPVSGTAKPNSQVTVLLDGGPFCSTTADGAGNWTCNGKAPINNGDHTITATTTSGAGTSAPASVSFSSRAQLAYRGGGGCNAASPQGGTRGGLASWGLAVFALVHLRRKQAQRS